jgi:hypothetical protein
MVELSAGMKISRILASTRHARRRRGAAACAPPPPPRWRSRDAEGSSVEWRWRRPAIAGDGRGEESRVVRLWWLAGVVAAAAALGVSEAGRISRGRGERCWRAAWAGRSLLTMLWVCLPKIAIAHQSQTYWTSPIAIKLNIIFYNINFIPLNDSNNNWIKIPEILVTTMVLFKQFWPILNCLKFQWIYWSELHVITSTKVAILRICQVIKMLMQFLVST